MLLKKKKKKNFIIFSIFVLKKKFKKRRKIFIKIVINFFNFILIFNRYNVVKKHFIKKCEYFSVMAMSVM